jgi:transcriptional regulator of acetoin/glycerol metabolism
MAHRTNHAERVRETVEKKQAAATSGLAASWRRSMMHFGLSPDQITRAEFVSERDLSTAKERLDFLLHVAHPTLEKLYKTVVKSGCCVVMSDIDGVILASQSQDGDRMVFDQWGLATGAVWSEAQQGTNGIGTCAIEQRPVVIHRDQHFKSQNTQMSCMGAPIFDNHGKLIAVLDVSSARSDLTSGFANVFGKVVADTAQRIEQDYFRAAYAQNRIVIAPTEDMSATALFAVDQDELIVGANRHARKAFALNDEEIANPKPLADVVRSGARPTPSLADAEKSEMRRTLARTKGNVSEAAKHLGISRATMYRRMQRLGISAN